MEPSYSQTFTLSDIYLDCHRRLKPSMILYFAQEVAAQHCIRLHLDWETLAAQGVFWAVIRHRVHVTRLPEAGETIRVETWPMPTTRTAYPRNVVAYDGQGNELFRVMSLWVLMDLNTRCLVLPGKSKICVEGMVRGTELPAPASLPPRELENSLCRYVRFSDLDRNGHMNNAKYLDWISDLFPSGFHEANTPREITLCYLSECREGDALQLGYALHDGVLRVEATRESPHDGTRHRIFAAEIHYEP